MSGGPKTSPRLDALRAMREAVFDRGADRKAKPVPKPAKKKKPRGKK